MLAFVRKFFSSLGCPEKPVEMAPSPPVEAPAEPLWAANARILTQDHGLGRTLESKIPEAADGSPLPWYTYPAIEYCNQINAEGCNIFEFGSGNSSLYWARKGAKVWCVEHDAEWHATMARKSAHLQALMLQEEKDGYAAAIGATGETFDIVIVDGMWRNESADAALPYLREGGLIILDNSDWYHDTAEFLRSKGFFQVDFNGFGPCNPYCWTTSLFLPFQSRFIQRLGMPNPIGGIAVFKGETW